MNKVNQVGSNVSFKGFYKVQGSEDALNEVCWYLQKKRKASEHAFDFLDIRLIKKPKTPLQNAFSPDLLQKKAQKEHDPVDMGSFVISGGYAKEIMDLVMQKPSVGVAMDSNMSKKVFHLMDPHQVEHLSTLGKTSEAVVPEDLFVTGADKPLVEKTLNSILEASLVGKASSFVEKAKLLIGNRTQMDENVSHGMPVTNLSANAVKQFFPLKLMEIPILKAQEVLEKIQKGKFNIETGLSLEG